ncbi:MerR family DNA-binding protein [Longimicrobium sp.]|uniref:MerR family DNA-binding protein n=1 Tax=Longimicrobium sp. TaxID=2029185 RepID=UPI002E3739DF|nr:MerR family DNA-binding protein [Longimicrobium sp.]HEX6037759.1 MerR family DNA-binding protein [Longimicrobium sp.]
MAAHTIGSVAREAGVGIETIRFYEREGLIGKASRTPSGYRQFPDDVIERIRFIQRAKDLGFSLAEIRELLAMRVRSDSECEDVRHRAEAKIANIEAKISDLDRIRRALSELTRACATGRHTDECPILECLSRGGEVLLPTERKHREEREERGHQA